MSELMAKLRERVDKLIEPHRNVYGDEAPTVKMALLVLAEAETIAQQLGEERIGTDRAHEITGWSPETLQRYARAVMAGEEVPQLWKDLIVEKTPSGYVFQLGSIPPNPRASAA